jgi:hypothetical protein
MADEQSAATAGMDVSNAERTSTAAADCYQAIDIDSAYGDDEM